jgi:tetratricopeptide (TPR) repeat protein
MMRALGAVQLYGGYDKAEHLLRQALLLDPENAEIYHNRGMLYSRSECWQAALADFGNAITLSPHPMSYEQRATVHYRLGNRQAAKQDLEQALRLDRQRFQALANLGWFAFEEQRYLDAVGYLSAAIEVEPTMSAAYAHRARAYWELGQMDKAMADLRAAEELIDSGADTSNNERFE